MGYIKADSVKVHLSKNKKICLKFPFINKNNDIDNMYIEIDERIIDEIAIMEEIKEE